MGCQSSKNVRQADHPPIKKQTPQGDKLGQSQPNGVNQPQSNRANQDNQKVVPDPKVEPSEKKVEKVINKPEKTDKKHVKKHKSKDKTKDEKKKVDKNKKANGKRGKEEKEDKNKEKVAEFKKKLGYKPMVIPKESPPTKITISKLSSSQFEKMKGALFVKTMQYKLTLAGEYNDTLEERVARLITNDLGETLRTEVSYALIQEFKKFMFLNALSILERKRSKDVDSAFCYHDKLVDRVCYNVGYHPHYLLDLVWRFIIQEGKIYADFCNAICGGFIDRINPRVDLKSTFNRYTAARAEVEKHRDLLRPYWAVWPNIDCAEELELDYDYDMLFHMKEKEKQLTDFRAKIQEKKMDDFKVIDIRDFIDTWKYNNKHDFGEDEELEIDENADFSKYSKRKEVDYVEIFYSLMEYKFDERFVKPICMMFMLTEKAGMQLIVEYKMFLFIYFLTE